MGITPRWFTLGLTVFLAFVGSLSFSGPTSPHENPSPQQSHLESRPESRQQVFWELQPAQVDAMLLPIPDGDNSRYLHLHDYFSDLHCPSEMLVEQAVPKHVGKNLMCILPGKNSAQILVVSRYDRRRERTGEGWSEAVILPILYNALRAQPRQQTFVFVALCGSAGEKEFFLNLRKNNQPTVKAIVAVDSLGMGESRFYAPSNKLLETEAVFTAHLQGISVLMNDQGYLENTVLSRAEKIPSILIHSGYGRKVSTPDFRKEFDFVAYYLCRIDTRLAMLTNPPTH